MFISSILLHPEVQFGAGNYSKIKNLNAGLVPVMALGVTFGVFIMFCMHLSFLNNNETTIEYGELNIGAEGNPYRLNAKDGNIR